MTMIEPKSKLPWRIVPKGYGEFSGTEDNNHIFNSEEQEVLGTSEWLRLEDQDAEYIIRACNNFPKAFELLERISRADTTREEYFKLREEIDVFVKQIKEEDGEREIKESNGRDQKDPG